jgi:NADPH:quinone reductase
MRKAVCRAWGPPETLEIEESPTPEPGEGKVLVEVSAAGVNFVDALMVQGTYQIKVPPPFTPGFEAAGVVAAVGAGVEGWVPGDRAIVLPGFGGYASHLLVSPLQLVRLPAEVSDAAMAAFVQSYSTMWFALTQRTQLAAGESVLVLGAGGGLGLAAIDVAKSFGARVIAAASSDDKLAAAKAMGADDVVNYETEDLKTRVKELSGGGVDVIVDPIGGRMAEAALRAGGWYSRFLVLGFASGPIPALPANLMLLNNRTVVGVDWGAWQTRNPQEQRSMLELLVAKAAAGELHPVEPLQRPLAEAGAVLRDAVERRITAKVVLAP